MKTLYIDIETIPGEEKPPMDSIKVPANYKDEAKIQAYKEANLEDEWHKQSLNSMKGRILCVGVACDDRDPIVYTDLAEFDRDVMSIREEVQWVGHNIAKFDAKWLVRHGIQLGLSFPSLFNLDRYRGNVRDTMTMWACGDYQDYTKLDDLARFLGLPGKTEGMDGSQVWAYYKAGRIDEIKDYCADDVRLTRDIYKRIVPYTHKAAA